MFENTAEAILVLNQKFSIETSNHAFLHICGYQHKPGQDQDFFTLLGSQRHHAPFYDNIKRALMRSGYWQGEVWLKHQQQHDFPSWLTLNRVEDQQGQFEHFIAVFSDISSIKESRHKNTYLASHDGLTGLANRSQFIDILRQTLSHCRRKQLTLALLFIDIDNFKSQNDMLGHDAGDDLLCMVSQRLYDLSPNQESLARLSGDEFALLLADMDISAVDQLAHRISDDLSASYQVQDRHIYLTTSIGIAVFPEDGYDSSGLIKACDAALQRAQELGRNRIEYFVPDLYARLLCTLSTRKAIRN